MIFGKISNFPILIPLKLSPTSYILDKLGTG